MTKARAEDIGRHPGECLYKVLPTPRPLKQGINDQKRPAVANSGHGRFEPAHGPVGPLVVHPNILSYILPCRREATKYILA